MLNMPRMYNPFAPSVDALVASLNKTVDRLEKLVVRNNALAKAKREQADALLDEVLLLRGDVARASRISARIANLID